MNRIKTQPTLYERMTRNPAWYALLMFIVFFAFIGAAEFICVMLDAGFDVRAG